MANMRLVKLKYRPSKGVFVFEYMSVLEGKEKNGQSKHISPH